MSTPTQAQFLDAGLALANLGMALASGRPPEIQDIIATLSAVAVDLAPIEDLKAALDAADQVRIDRAAELVAEDKLGPRP